MKKGILFLMLSVLTLGAWAQTTSPYTGVAVSDIVSGNDYYLYNVESGLWLQNNDRKSSDWSTRAQLGCRGLDFQLNAVTGGYKINAKFGRASLNRGDYYLDNNDDHVWVFEAKSGSVSNAVTIKSDTRYLTADNYTAGKPYNNMYKVGEPKTAQWYLNNPENSTNGTWQIVTKEERLAKMVADGATQPADATWLIKSPDFANNDTRYNSWTKHGTWARGGDADGDYGRGSMIVESYNSGSDVQISQEIKVPNGIYELTFQGFYRDGSVEDVGTKYNNGTEEIRAKFFANHEEAFLRSIIDPDHTSALNDPARWPTQTGGTYYVPNSMADCSRAMNLENVYHNDPIEVTVTDGILVIGVKKTGSVGSDWVILDNFKLTYLGPVVDLTPYLNNLTQAITDAEAYNGETTDALQSALDNALTAAQAATSSQDADEISIATSNLNNARLTAEAVDVSVLRPTVALAKAEGIDVAAQEAYLANGTTNEVADQLFSVRTLRKLNAQRQPDIYTGASSPAAGTTYFLYNVGTGMWLTNASDWNSHAAVGMYGIEITLTASGDKWIMNTPFGKLNWNAYVDTEDNNTWTFNPVEGKTNVFTINSEGNRVDVGRLLGYDPFGPTDKGNYHFWSTVAKDRENVNNPNNQWKLVTKEERDNLVAAASMNNPVDASYLIKNPALSRKPGLENNWDLSVTPGDKPKDLKSSEDDGDFNRNDDYAVEFWDFQTFNITQTITGLTPGLYEVGVQAFYRHSSSDGQREKLEACSSLDELVSKAYLYANEEKVLLPNIATVLDKLPGIATVSSNKGSFLDGPKNAIQAFETGYYKQTVRVAVGNDGELTIGVTQPEDAGDGFGGSWVMVDNFRLTYLGPTSESVTVSPAGYATFASDNALDFTGSSIKAFYATESAGTLSFTQVNKVPAGTGVLLYKDGGATESVPVFTGAADAVTGNVFVRGTGAAVTYADNDQNYILFNGEDGIGFYKANNNTVATNRAYIHVANGSGVKGFVINLEDDATGISDLKDSKDLNDSKVIYNLAGQRISKMQKGINIVNGKKILK